MTRWLFIILFYGLLNACASLHSYRPMSDSSEMPVAIQPLFSSCFPSDGAAQFNLKGKDKNISGVEIVWNTPAEETWDIQFNTLLGDTQMEMRKRAEKFEVLGRSDVQISRDNAGVLTVNGARLPLLDAELPCLLAGHWPVSWLKLMGKRSQGGQSPLHLIGGDSLRTFDLTASVSQGARTIDSCSVVEWGGFLGLFKHSSKVCIKRWSGGYSVSVDGPSSYFLKWSVENEPG